MKQKHLIMIVVIILAAALVLGLILSRCGKETEPSGGSLQAETEGLSGDEIHLGSSTDSADQTDSETASGQTSTPSSELTSNSTGESGSQLVGQSASGESASQSSDPSASGSSGQPASESSGQSSSGSSGQSASGSSSQSSSGSSGQSSSGASGQSASGASGQSASGSSGQSSSGASGQSSSGASGQSSSGSSSGSSSQSSGQSTSGSAGAQDTHTHTFVAVETVAPTASEPGYTRYVCSDCGYSYMGNIVAGSSLQQLVNKQKLSPAATGINTLDREVSSILSEIIPQGASNYEKLEAIYNYILTDFSHGGGSVDVNKIMAFSDGKVFKNASELVISYEAYQMLTEKQGVSDQYAAAFMVLTRAAGFESYVVNGSLNGSSHVWNNVRIGGTLYAFDTYSATAPQFAVRDQDLSGYFYQDKTNTIAAQTGFQRADAFMIRLTLTGENGVTAKEYVWDVDDMPSGASNFMVNPITVQAKGVVSYTLEIVSGSGSFQMADEKGNLSSQQKAGSSIFGTLASGGYYTLQVEETDSMMHFDIHIDN